MPFKRCFKCLLEKPLEAFYRHSMMGDGHLNKCKDCTKIDVYANRMQKISYYREYDRMRGAMPHRVAKNKEYAQTERGKTLARISRRRWNEHNAHKKNASIAVNNAIRDGRLSKEPCFVCGDEKSQAHHAAYDLPLHVTWLCPRHHAQAHKEHRQWLREKAA